VEPLPLDELGPAYEPELLDDPSPPPELADDAGAGVSEAHPPPLATTETSAPSAIANGSLRVIAPHLKATVGHEGRDRVIPIANHDRPVRKAQQDPARGARNRRKDPPQRTDKCAQAVLFVSVASRFNPVSHRVLP
jgi:hypothetical protein